MLPNPHKLPKDMYHSMVLVKELSMGYEKIDVCRDNCMLFWKEYEKEKKCLKCGKSRYVDVVNEDSETVSTDVAHKQLRYMLITPRIKRLFLLKKLPCTCGGKRKVCVRMIKSWSTLQMGMHGRL